MFILARSPREGGNVTPPRALTIAGSDPSGGAGVQADLKTMSAFGVYGTSAVTSITVQNTVGVTRAVHLPAAVVAAQIDAVMEDIGADAAKTGMLPDGSIVEAVAERIGRFPIPNVVVDPVMRASSGFDLVEESSLEALKRSLLPLATLVTPNVPEAEALTGRAVESLDGMKDVARAIYDLGAGHVLITGGHLGDDATDLFFDGSGFERFTESRSPGAPVHGTGCTLSAAITSCLARGLALVPAISSAKTFVTRAIASSLTFGSGRAVVNHLVSVERE